MKIIYISLSLFMVSLLCNTLQAQDDPVKERIEILMEEREAIILAEREKLKAEVESINAQLEANTISADEARVQKEEAAEKHARNIENKTAIIDNRIALLERNESLEEDDGLSSSDAKRPSPKWDNPAKRIVSAPVIAVGFNNLIDADGNLQDNDIKLAGSRFFEFGWLWKLRVFKNSDWLQLTVGTNWQYNGLKPTGNRIFVMDGSQTHLETYPENLDKSKFRILNIVAPIHFEFRPFNRVDGVRSNFFSLNNFNFGIGGYLGTNSSNKNLQKLKYKSENLAHLEKLTGEYNANGFVYGLSAYIGFSPLTVYAKYEMTPLFKNNPIDHHNVSLGLRWDMNVR